MVRVPRTLTKSIFRLIRQTRGRFAAITAIVTLGVAFFVGVSSTSLIMDRSVDIYMDDTELKDITIYSNYGFDEEDLAAIRAVDGVRKAEGAYFTDAVGTSGNLSYITRVHSYNENDSINRIVLKEGRMPENIHEALAEAGTDLMPGFPLGSVIQLRLPDGTDNGMLKMNEVTVVGLADTPLYLNETKENSTLSNQYLRTFLYVNEEAFDSGCWLEINAVTEKGKAFDAFSDNYQDDSETVRISIEELALTQENARYTKLKDDAEKEYAEGYAEYEKGRKEYEDGIREGEKKLADGEAEIRDGEAELASARKQLNDAESTLDEEYRRGKKTIDDAMKQIDEGQRQLDDAQKQLQDAEAEVMDAASHSSEIHEGIAQIDEALRLLGELSELIDPAVSVLDLSEEDIEKLKETLDILSSADPAIPLSEITKEYRGLTVIIDAFGLEETDTLGDLTDRLAMYLDDTRESEERIKAIEETIAEADRRREELSAQLQKMLDEKLPYEEQSSELRKQLEETDARLAQLEETMQGIAEAERQIRDLRTLVQNTGDLLGVLAETDPDMPLLQVKELYPESTEIIDMLGLRDEDSLSDLIREGNAFISSSEEKIADLIEHREMFEGNLQDLDIASLPSLIASLKEQKAQLEDALRKIDDGIAAIEAGKKEIAENLAALEKGRKEAEEGRRLLEKKIAEARRQISDGRKEISRNAKLLAEGKEELQKGREELEKARAEGLSELQDAADQLADAREQIDAMALPEWTVLDRQSHYASVTYDGTIDQMKAIGEVFPLFFILVAALVCLTTMTRMIDEQRGEIGILRALGYTRMQCAGKYLVYAGAATILGSVLGTGLGLLIFPYIIYNTWKMMYVLPEMALYVPWILVAQTVTSFLAAMLGVTWYACRSDTGDVPSQLMRPKSPKLGKNLLIERISLLWNRFSFTWKVTMRNLFRYKKRFFMTVAGVAGCTALLVTGFGIRDSINNMVDIQFYDIYRYSGVVSCDAEGSQRERLIDELKGMDSISAVIPCDSYSAKAYGASALNETVAVQIFDSPDLLEEAYNLRVRGKNTPLRLDDDGVIISEKLSENMKLKPGDSFRMEDADGVLHEFRVSAVTEMYIRHYAFISRACYERVTGGSVEGSTLLIASDDSGNMSLQEKIVNMDHVTGIEFFDAVLDNFRTMVKSLDLIVWTLIISSMSLAFVVLGNLINVNISERQREIATLKVLGFRRREVTGYIYKENNILTLIGAACGLPLGNLLHHYIMRMVEMDYIMFGRTVNPMSFAISFVMTFLFGILVDRAMAPKLHGIKMVESLKSVE